MASITSNLTKTAYNYADACASLSEHGDHKEWKSLKAEFKTQLQSANWSSIPGFTESFSDEKVRKKVEKFSDAKSSRVVTADEIGSTQALGRSLGESYQKMKAVAMHLGTRSDASEMGLPAREMSYFGITGENRFKPEIKKPFMKEVKKLAGELEKAPHRESLLAERISAMRAPLASLPEAVAATTLQKIETRVYNFWAKSFAASTKDAVDREDQLASKLAEMGAELKGHSSEETLSKFAESVHAGWAKA